MADDCSIDEAALRERLPWVGLAEVDQPDLAGRYREIMARDREIVETIELIQRSV